MLWVTVLNYVVWYIFIFLAIFWLLVLLRNRHGLKKRQKLSHYPSVTVLIPAHNEEKTIARTIKSVLSLDWPKNLLEVIVINDGSTDKTAKIVRSFKTVKMINNKKNIGKAASLNKGIKAAKGELIACIDADSIVEKKALKKMVPFFSDPDVAVVTPALKVWKTSNLLEKAQHAEYFLNIFMRKMLALIDAVHVTPGVFSVYRKSVLKKVGGFEPGNLTEDMEIALRIHKAGYKIENSTDASSYTLCPAKMKELFVQRIRWYRGAIENSIKYRSMFFNPKYGNLGLFFLPLNFIAIISIIVLFFIILNNVINWISGIAWKALLINFDIKTMAATINLPEILANMLNTSFILAIISIIIASGILWFSFKMCRSSIKHNKSGYLFYILMFPLIMMIFWAFALIETIIGKKRRW
ncbi:MAG: glycosyltransferase [Candidatus Aenigmatarchaeota archaeon]